MDVQIRQPVFLTFHGHRRLCRVREVVNVAPEIAERLVNDGRAVAVEAPAEPILGDYEAHNVGPLQIEADRRGLTVEGTGTDGRVVKADLVAALTANDGEA